MAQQRTPDLEPPTAYQRGVIISAITFTIFAATLFVAILFVGSGGGSQLGRVFTPIAITATALGLVGAIAAIVDKRTRTVGITTALVLVPCSFLALLSIVALTSG